MTHKFSLELYRAAMGDYPSVFEHLARPLEVVWSSNRFNTTYHGGVIEVGDGEELPENEHRRLEVELTSQCSPEEQAEQAAADKKKPKDAQALFAERNGINAWSNRVPARFPNIGLVIFKKDLAGKATINYSKFHHGVIMETERNHFARVYEYLREKGFNTLADFFADLHERAKNIVRVVPGTVDAATGIKTSDMLPEDYVKIAFEMSGLGDLLTLDSKEIFAELVKRTNTVGLNFDDFKSGSNLGNSLNRIFNAITSLIGSTTASSDILNMLAHIKGDTTGLAELLSNIKRGLVTVDQLNRTRFEHLFMDLEADDLSILWLLINAWLSTNTEHSMCVSMFAPPEVAEAVESEIAQMIEQFPAVCSKTDETWTIIKVARVTLRVRVVVDEQATNGDKIVSALSIAHLAKWLHVDPTNTDELA
jgi:hypothetical protein